MRKITPKQFRRTMQIIKKLEPMIQWDEYDIFRGNQNSPKLDIKVLEPDGKNTMWGDAQMSDHYVTDDLTEAGLEFMDWLEEGYEIWFKKQPLVYGEESDSLTDVELHFVISWLVGEFYEGMTGEPISECPIINIRQNGKWYILGSFVAPDVFQRIQFWEKFGVGEEYGPCRGWDENPIGSALFDGVILKRSEILDTYKVKRIKISEKMRSEGLPCQHCMEMSDKAEKEWKPETLEEIEKYQNSLEDARKKLKGLEREKEHLTKESYNRIKNNRKKIIELATELLKIYEKKDQFWWDNFIDPVIDGRSKEFYQCNYCKKSVCAEKACYGRKVVCQQCIGNMSDDIVKKEWPGHLEYWDLD